MDKVLNFIKRYRKFFALYLVFLFGCYIGLLNDGEFADILPLVMLIPLLLFILYLAFKPIKKPLR